MSEAFNRTVHDTFPSSEIELRRLRERYELMCKYDGYDESFQLQAEAYIRALKREEDYPL